MSGSGTKSGRFDLLSPQTLFRAQESGELPDLYEQLAAEAPLWQLPGVEHVYLACTRELVEEAIARPDLFSSNLTALLYRDEQGGPARYEMAPLDDPIHALATADPPRHTAQRRLLQPFLSRRAIEGWVPRVRAITQELLACLPMAGADIAHQLADPLTMRVVCLVIGVPEQDASEFVEAVIALDRLISGLADRAEMDAGAGASLMLGLRLRDYLTGNMHTDSILGALQAEIAAGNLTEDVAIGILLQLVTAGTETTATLIGRAVLQLAEDRQLQNQLRAHPDRIAEFLEDVLRDNGPFQFHSRTTREGATLGGAELPADSLVLLMWASANQNAAARPTELSLGGSSAPASPVSHLAFGRGIHFCIGAHLARMEAAVAIEELLGHTSDFVADPKQPPTSRPSLMMSRPTSLRINWRPS